VRSAARHIDRGTTIAANLIGKVVSE
jgi:hypothetical protein